MVIAKRKYDAKVLVVDDYPVNLDMTKEILEIMECDVDTAECGDEAITCYKEDQYNVILLDIQMPDRDGYSVCQEIRQIEKSEGKDPTPIIALTANAKSGDREKCLSAGMDDYISKPIRSNDLAVILDKYLKQVGD